MVMCILTVALGLAVISIGSAGMLRVAGFHGLTISGGAGAVIIVLGLFGVGC